MTGDRNAWVAALALELAPAAMFNFAVAFAVATLMRQSGVGEIAALSSVAAGIAAFLLAWLGLRSVGKTSGRFALAPFDQSVEAVPLEHATEVDELLLTEPVAAPGAALQSAEDELLLDDLLEIIGPESRVVRLFEPNGIPTAGELQARIDRHLRSDTPRPEALDATEALHEAIQALRQSLR